MAKQSIDARRFYRAAARRWAAAQFLLNAEDDYTTDAVYLASLQAAITRDLTKVNWWTTNLRYEPGTLHRSEAERFFRAAETILLWGKGKV